MATFEGYISMEDLVNTEGILPKDLLAIFYALPSGTREGVCGRIIQTTSKPIAYIANEDIPIIREFYRKKTSRQRRFLSRCILKQKPYDGSMKAKKYYFPDIIVTGALSDKEVWGLPWRRFLLDSRIQ